MRRTIFTLAFFALLFSSSCFAAAPSREPGVQKKSRIIGNETKVSSDDCWDLKRGDCAEITIPAAPSNDGNGWVSVQCLLVEKYYLKNVIRTTWLKINE